MEIIRVRDWWRWRLNLQRCKKFTPYTNYYGWMWQFGYWAFTIHTRAESRNKYMFSIEELVKRLNQEQFSEYQLFVESEVRPRYFNVAAGIGDIKINSKDRAIIFIRKTGV